MDTSLLLSKLWNLNHNTVLTYMNMYHVLLQMCIITLATTQNIWLLIFQGSSQNGYYFFPPWGTPASPSLICPCNGNESNSSSCLKVYIYCLCLVTLQSVVLTYVPVRDITQLLLVRCRSSWGEPERENADIACRQACIIMDVWTDAPTGTVSCYITRGVYT